MKNIFLIFVTILLLSTLVISQQPTATSTESVQQTSTSTSPTQPPSPHTLLDGTPVKLRLSQTISSANSKVGDEIPFEVIEDVSVDNVVVLPKGSTAIATVTDAEHKKSMGRAGKLNISISYARLKDNEKVALRAIKDNKGGGHVGAMTGAMVATSIVFFPAAPLFLFVHGKDVTIPQGTEITAFVQGDMHLDMKNFGASPDDALAKTSASSAQATLVIDSSPGNADIEIDGVFTGNTPSSLTVTPGMHEITIKKKGYEPWSRKMNVASGNIHLNAELDSVTTTPGAQPVQSTPSAQPATANPQ